MASTAGIELGQARRDGTVAATVTDLGGLVVHGAVDPAAAPAALPLSLDDVAFVVSVAGRAPSLHNTQPWKFKVRGNVIELVADTSRLLRHVDPAGRELTISCGAALFGLRLGLRRLGYIPGVDVLPDAAAPSLIARVRPIGRAATTRDEAELLAAVPHRHTHRGPFTGGEVPSRLFALLTLDAAAEGCELVLIEDPVLVGDLAVLVSAAAAEQRRSAQIAAELRCWVVPAGSHRGDGVPAEARLEGSDLAAAQHGVPLPRQEGCNAHDSLPQRDFGLPGTEQAGGMPPSMTAVLATAGDTAADWVRAGQALHRLLVHAATRWVFARLQSQPLESARHRDQVRALLGLTGVPQMLLQLGRANSAPATGRRSQGDVMAD